MHKTTHDKQGYAEEQRQPHLLACEVHDRCHYKSAEDGEQSDIPKALFHSPFNDFVGIVDEFGQTSLDGESHKCTSHNVADDDHRQFDPVLPGLNKPADPGIYFQLVAHHRDEAKREEHGSNNAAHFKERHPAK